MHIDDLISLIRPHLPFASEMHAKEIIGALAPDDQMALVSAMYIGRSNIHNYQLADDHIKAIADGYFNRNYEDSVPVDHVPTIFFNKKRDIATNLDAFQRCTDGSRFDRSLF